MNTVQMSKVAQTIFNRNGRENAAKLAEELVNQIVANLAEFSAEYGITDEFDLIEAIALDVVKELK